MRQRIRPQKSARFTPSVLTAAERLDARPADIGGHGLAQALETSRPKAGQVITYMPIFAPPNASKVHALAGAIRGAPGPVQKAVGAEAS